ncbi:sortase domain-containing protein [Halomonas denitrificans]|nr:sortase [Halomonas denitrificans]
MSVRIGMAVALLAAASLLLGHAGWIHVKGSIGQWLMERTWSMSERDGTEPELPWPGARTRPVARLFVPDLDVDRLVVDGIELPKLAWGPGLVTGHRDHHVIAGHRDTHFRFLGNLRTGDDVQLQFAPVGATDARPSGPSDWIVAGSKVVDSRTARIDLDAPGPRLTLVTCYPLDAGFAGTPLRLVVSARPRHDDPLSEASAASVLTAPANAPDNALSGVAQPRKEERYSWAR